MFWWWGYEHAQRHHKENTSTDYRKWKTKNWHWIIRKGKLNSGGGLCGGSTTVLWGEYLGSKQYYSRHVGLHRSFKDYGGWWGTEVYDTKQFWGKISAINLKCQFQCIHTLQQFNQPIQMLLVQTNVKSHVHLQCVDDTKLLPMPMTTLYQL